MQSYTAYFKARIHAKNTKSAINKALDHIKTKYESTMVMTDLINQIE